MAIRSKKSSGNVFSDMGFESAEAEHLRVRSPPPRRRPLAGPCERSRPREDRQVQRGHADREARKGGRRRDAQPQAEAEGGLSRLRLVLPNDRELCRTHVRHEARASRTWYLASGCRHERFVRRAWPAYATTRPTDRGAPAAQRARVHPPRQGPRMRRLGLVEAECYQAGDRPISRPRVGPTP